MCIILTGRLGQYVLLKTILRTFYVAPTIPRYNIQLFVLILCL